MSHSPILKVTLGSGANQQDISDRITSLTYKRSLTHDDTVDIDVQDADAEWLIEQPCCYAGSPLTFSYGFIGGNMSAPVTLAIGDIEPEYSGKNGCTLSISSVDASQAMKKLHSNKVWKDMRIDQIIQALAEIHGLRAEIQTFMTEPHSQEINLENSVNRSSDSTTNAELQTTNEQTNPQRQATYKNISAFSINGSKPVPFKTFQSFPQGWQSNYGMMQNLTALAGIGFINYVKNGVIYFVQRNNAAPPIRIIRRGTDDITRFKIKYREINGKGSEDRTGTVTYDPKSVETYIQIGEYHLIGSDSVIMRVNPDGSRQVLSRDFDMSSMGGNTDNVWYTIETALQSKNITNINPENIEKYLMGKQTNTSIRQAIEETFATAQEGIQEIKDSMLTATLVENPGRVDMDINATIGVAGFASRYNGNWFIYEVTDSITKDGFITTSELRKGEVKKGTVPTTNANTSSSAEPLKRKVDAVDGWDFPKGVDINNPQTNAPQTQKITPKEIKKATITTR